MHRALRRASWGTSVTLAVAGLACFGISAGSASAAPPDNSANTTTPIKHVVVIFDENESFDHYFGTYPNAANQDGVPFTAAAGTPVPNNFVSHPELVTANPNSSAPFRLTSDQAATCSQNHGYLPEQKAFDAGKMDKFPENTNAASTCATSTNKLFYQNNMVMGYYDGNTVTAMWNYAQNYALNDNSWDTTFGPSTPGALNLISGQTYGALAVDSVSGAVKSSTNNGTVDLDPTTHLGTVTGDPDPAFDDCSDNDHTSTSDLTKLQGKNIGDLLNAKGVTWGWFQGGFKPSTPADQSPTGYAQCETSHPMATTGTPQRDYSPHHSPFEYYASTSNQHHLPPVSPETVGYSDQANHNYDVSDFDDALAAGNLPAVSFLKPASYQDAHPANSDPIDEQNFLVKEINSIEKSPQWSSTAIVIAYDDSDGWYDHVAPTILNGSTDAANNDVICTDGPAAANGYQDRCGPGPRLPLLVISPFAKQNAVDSTMTEQTSVLKFVEDNWQTGRIGGGSFDERAGALTNMFDFAHPQQRAVILADNGTVSQVIPVTVPSGTITSTPKGGDTGNTVTAGNNGLAATGIEPAPFAIGAGLLVLAGAIALMLVRTRRRARP